MSKASDVTVVPARPSDAPLLANLLELYVHDLSAVFTHVRLGADGLTAALGYYTMTGAQLERYRHAVIDETGGAQLAEMAGRLRARGLEVGGGQTLKNAPRGYPKDNPRLGLLRSKGLICWRHWPVAPWLHTGKAKDRVAGVLRTAAPLHQWQDRNVGRAEG